MGKRLAVAVRKRAGFRCEYCRLPADYTPMVPFPIDHIIARQHGGTSELSNLALSCLHCNSHKGPNVAGRDPKTGRLTPLFHPRRHVWDRHFRWDGIVLIGRTAIGRVTVFVLNINAPEYLKTRSDLIAAGGSMAVD